MWGSIIRIILVVFFKSINCCFKSINNFFYIKITLNPPKRAPSRFTLAKKTGQDIYLSQKSRLLHL